MARKSTNIAPVEYEGGATIESNPPMTVSITIAGREFTVPAPYEAGPRDLTSGEAHALNQVFHENIRNNLAKKIKEGAGQAEVDAYAQSYAFGIRAKGAGRGPSDPVGSEAFKLAKAAVINALRAKGSKNPVKDYGAEAIGERAKRAVANDPKWRRQAEESLATLRAMADEALADDLEPMPQAEAAE